MISLSIVPDLEVVGFQDTPYMVHEHEGALVIGGMAKGTESGKPVVMIGVKLADNDYLVAQTTLSLFLTAADALKAKHGDPRE